MSNILIYVKNVINYFDICVEVGKIKISDAEKEKYKIVVEAQ